MAFSRKNYLRVRDEFSQKAFRAQREAQERTTDLHRRYPESREIDRALAATGAAVFAETMRGPVGLEERLEKLRCENRELQESRAQCLRYHGLPVDYTDPHYECARCSDTGEVMGRMCPCMKRALVLATYESSGIGALLKTQTFDTFDLSYYAAGESRAAAEAALRICRDFALNFPNSAVRNITLQGATGLGKTHLSTAMAKEVIDRGFDVVYDTAQNILGTMEDVRFGRLLPEDGDTQRFFACDLLMIDDLGTETNTQFTVGALYNLLNTRINAGRATVVSTNLTVEDFRRRYADRITSRLLGEFTMLPLTGRDIRSQKLQGR